MSSRVSRFTTFVPPDHGGRPRILALCGAKSNNEVTRLQLENLNITEANFDIFFLHGPIIEDDGGEGLQGMVHGPFYSWIDQSDARATDESIVNGVRLVLQAVQHHGPFDGIYGFSNGGLIAALAANSSNDVTLGMLVDSSPKSTQKHIKRTIVGDKDVVNPRVTAARASVITAGLRTSELGKARRTTTRHTRMSTVGGMRRTRMTGMGAPLITRPPFEFCVIACAGVSWLESLDGLTCSDLFGEGGDPEDGSALIGTRSMHLVGLEDPLKAKSEKIACLFRGAKVVYLPGGHAIGRGIASDDNIVPIIKDFVRDDNPEFQRMSEFREMNAASHVAMQKNVQVAIVDLKQGNLPSGMYGNATIVNCLSSQPYDKPFLFNARNPDHVATTYGQALDFIIKGEGDLRRLGIKPGEVVSYAAPPGGSASAALAFLSIGAQTCAAPLAPNMTEPEVLDALDQFHAKHLILFEDFKTPGVEDAFKIYQSQGKGKLHWAKLAGDDQPGVFKYTSEAVDDFESAEPLMNPEDGNCLLLRTSGTTARPKGVPLIQGSLVNNGALIGNAMLLKDTDVCYSVMPLFHIGGISASILCSLATGGAVCCDGEPFDPGRMVDALAISNPQPTWYSSVPTIHNTTVAFLRDHAKNDPKYAGYGIDVNTGIWEKGHSLRMIRSGAAALLIPDAEALTRAYGGLPIYPTYSMSEQMPISQPPAGKGDTVTDKPGSVGVPVAASVAIVSRSHLTPQPFGAEGEIAISGPTVMKNYLENPEADAKNYFYLTSLGNDGSLDESRYFLTGDVGVLDSEGFLSLKGRAKELIKKGGEQVSPYEVEEALLDHPWVQTPVCFSVPSAQFGEEVGCAIVLSSEAPPGIPDNEVIKSLRRFMKDQKFAPIKWPTKWWFGPDEELPKTKTKKYIRVGLAEKLGFTGEEDATANTKLETKAKVDFGVITGFRFLLSCYVMFTHIGSTKAWGSFANVRGMQWHTHCFFLLGGYSMALPMNPDIKKKWAYFVARMGNMYPMYFMALIFAVINLLVVCRPSTFDPNFHWNAQPGDHTRAPFCEGTPATPTSWWGSFILTLFVYIFGLQVTPFWPISWFLGYYLWFMSMYYQSLAVFPVVYNWLRNKLKDNLRSLMYLMIALQVLNEVIVIVAWFSMKDGQGYTEGETPEPGSAPIVTNAAVLSFYLFTPFWALYFVIGAVLAFIYDTYKPGEKHNSYVWGYVADICTLIMLGLTAILIAQPEGCEDKMFRPELANNSCYDTNAVYRMWSDISGRLLAPLTTLWIFGLSTGEGFTAKLLRNDFWVNTLGPHGYNCYLFHQMVGQVIVLMLCFLSCYLLLYSPGITPYFEFSH